MCAFINPPRPECLRQAFAALAFILGLAAATSCAAQSATALPAVSERVQREAAAPMRWIKLHSELQRMEPEQRAAGPAVRASLPSAAPGSQAAGRPARSQLVAVAPMKPVPMAPVTATPQNPAPSAPTSFPSLAESDLVVIDQAEPEWDDEVIRRLGKGRVLVRFHVSEDGYLSRIQIVESASPRLTGPVVAAVMQWRFEPIPKPRTASIEFGFDTDLQRTSR